MESGTSLQSKVSSAPNARSVATRQRPLHACGVASAAIARKAYCRMERLDGPAGILVQKVATLLGPFLVALQYHCLSILSSVDHHILTAETKAEAVFPPSVYLFDRIDALVQASENVPDRFDEVLDKALAAAQQIRILNWACQVMGSILGALMARLTDWGRAQVETEKEIMIDANSHEDVGVAAEASDSPTTSEDLGSEKKSYDEARPPTYKEVLEKKTYKEALEKGTRNEDEEGEEAAAAKVVEQKKVSVAGNEDPILQLFASAWHMK